MKLEEWKTASFTLIYDLVREELTVLREYIDNILIKG